MSILALAAATLLLLLVEGKKPHIVLIMTDDQDMVSLDYMPRLQKLLAKEGATFNSMYASTPVCCPSRSALWSGQYQHNHRVFNNSVEGNCSSPLWQGAKEGISVPVFMEAAG